MPSFNVGSRAVPRNKTKVDGNERLVEASAETPPGALSQLVEAGKAPLVVAEGVPLVAAESAHSVAAEEIRTPSEYLKMHLLPAAKFSLISLAFASVTYFIYPTVLAISLNNSYMRTALLALFIWNLIGAVLFAQTRERWAKWMIVVFFALPIATAGLWLPVVLVVITTLYHFLPPT